MNRRRAYHMAVSPCLPQDALYRRRRNINPVTIVDGRFWLFRPASIFARTVGSTTGVVSDMPMTLHRLLKVFAALFVLSACSPLTILNATIGEDGFIVQSGLSFGPEVRHGLDVYVPKPRTGLLPIVVFFYGGNWRAGERANYRFVAAALASRGYVTIVPDYRLFPDVRFPAFVEVTSSPASSRSRSTTWVTRISGADAPAVTPTHDTPSSQPGSMSEACCTR